MSMLRSSLCPTALTRRVRAGHRVWAGLPGTGAITGRAAPRCAGRPNAVAPRRRGTPRAATPHGRAAPPVHSLDHGDTRADRGDIDIRDAVVVHDLAGRPDAVVGAARVGGRRRCAYVAERHLDTGGVFPGPVAAAVCVADAGHVARAADPTAPARRRGQRRAEPAAVPEHLLAPPARGRPAAVSTTGDGGASVPAQRHVAAAVRPPARRRVEL